MAAPQQASEQSVPLAYRPAHHHALALALALALAVGIVSVQPLAPFKVCPRQIAFVMVNEQDSPIRAILATAAHDSLDALHFCSKGPPSSDSLQKTLIFQ
ncbi:hypothetical protein X747_32855 [Mesorhizobium sp. LNJC384A00]|uniref:hypothetical protein n=1 Tax=Mesorhizobium sp. LNJC384A00 TaxID=1287268 RepID=UPI0003CDE527|nr:hypothetical protein X747_32855 [Mesorhizobium sp. LNJC384A00]